MIPSTRPAPDSVRDDDAVLTPFTTPGPPSWNDTFTTGWAKTCWVCDGCPRRSQVTTQ